MIAAFLREVLEQEVGDPKLAQEKIEEALSDLGLAGLRMEDPLL